jgi:ABC-type transporter MlaC component
MSELKLTRRTLIAGVGSVAVATTFALPAQARDADMAKGFVERFFSDLARVYVEATSEAQRNGFISENVRGAFDISRIARIVAGRHTRRMTSDQIASFEQAFGDYFTRRQVDLFTNDLLGATFETGSVRLLGSESNGLSRYEISVQATLTNRPVVPITLSLYETEDITQISDMQIYGTSMVSQFRHEFSSLMSENGNNIDAVIAHYRSAL